MYPLMTPEEIEFYLPLIEKYRVSLKARSKQGFLYNYLLNGVDILNKPSNQRGMTWNEKRNLFVTRTLAAYKKKRTIRRFLSLIAWAYDPTFDK